MRYDFESQLRFSRGQREKTDIRTIVDMIDGCVRCEKTGINEDRRGIDYVAELRSGARVRIDGKARDAGCSKWWKRCEPDLALEKWSVVPHLNGNGRMVQKTGWTLNEKTETDLILFTYDPSDTERCFLLPFVLLRMAFRRFIVSWWKDPDFWTAEQNSTGSDGRTWKSECIFVPHWIVMSAIDQVSEGRLIQEVSQGSLSQTELFRDGGIGA